MSADIPSKPDPCRVGFGEPHCVYNLTLSSQSSQLIIHTPYIISIATFTGPEGTRGIPYQALTHFAEHVAGLGFSDARIDYCLPVLAPKVISCASATGRAVYEYLSTVTSDNRRLETYEITINPDTPQIKSYVSTASINGTMTVSEVQGPPSVAGWETVITATGGYAMILAQLAGEPQLPSYDMANFNETRYTTVCTISPGFNRSLYSSFYSWNMVTLSLAQGAITATTTNKSCTSAHNYTDDKPPFGGYSYALEPSAAIMSGTDGYSKLINPGYLEKSGAAYDYYSRHGMTPLEYILSQMYGIVQTWVTSTNTEAAHRLSPTHIMTHIYQHRYEIRLQWTAVTVLSFLVSVAVLVATIMQAVHWLVAVRTLHSKRISGIGSVASGDFYEIAEWDLLKPMDLMLFSAYTADPLTEILATQKARKDVLRQTRGPIASLQRGKPNVRDIMTQQRVATV